jgi:hypothetical protein
VSSVKVDLDKEKLRLLLRMLGKNQLGRGEAVELRPLLLRERRNSIRRRDAKTKRYVDELLHYLDKYIAGEVNLKTVGRSFGSSYNIT